MLKYKRILNINEVAKRFQSLIRNEKEFLVESTYRSFMFAFDVVVIHFFEREDFVAILTGVFKFNAFPVNFHKMSPILENK